jgi:excinuclease UvrABC ATPase subunit
MWRSKRKADPKKVHSTLKRLKEAFKDLRKENKLLARMNFRCCSTCAGYELATSAENLYERGKKVNGCVFWHHQDHQTFVKHGELRLQYGPLETKKFGTIGLDTKEVGKIVCEKLERYGIKYEWNGDPYFRILIRATL